MASKTNVSINGNAYFKICRKVGTKMSAGGFAVPVRKTFYGKSKKEAEEKYAIYMKDIESGKDATGIIFGEFADKWIKDFFLKDASLSYSTRELYALHWKNYVRNQEFYTFKLKDITPALLQNFYNTTDAPRSAVLAINKLMKKLYRHIEMNEISRDVTAHLVVPRRLTGTDKSDITVWSAEELQTIFNNFDKADPRFRMRFLPFVLYHTGVRISEALGLKHSDIDLEAKVIRIRRQVRSVAAIADGSNKWSIKEVPLKSQSSYRTIPMSEALIEQYLVHVQWQAEDKRINGYDTDFVFTTGTGGLYDNKNVGVMFKRYYKSVGVEYKSFHTYRHTFGTELCKKGIPIQIASALLGHSSIAVTAKYYVSIDDEQKRRAVNLL